MRNERDSKQPIVALEEHYKQILELLGEDSNRIGLERTPQRVAQAMCELTRGYDEDPSAELINSSFKEEYQRMVIVKDIRFFSMCEHHLLPFYGKVHVAYIPNQLVTGLSKIARVVDIFSHRLQVQERFTREIKECIEEALQPQGVIVYVEAEHMCVQMRGEEKQHAAITTIDYCGVFDDIEQRKEFISMIQKH